MKRILVALDGSPRNDALLSAAIGLGKRTGAKLVLLRVVGLPAEASLPIDVWAMDPNDVTTFLERRAREALLAAEKAVPEALRGGLVVRVGSPWDAIVRVAREEDVDAILIGSHGYDTLDHLLGTTAAKVVNHADRTVIVVRAPERLE